MANRWGNNGNSERLYFGGSNINNLRYADDSTLMAESKEELKGFLMKVKKRVKNLA